MAAVGLLYVGAVLFLNGVMLLGRVNAKAAGGLNLFVGGLQVITPTYLIISANGDSAKIWAASGLYLFGFTYLYVGIGLLANWDGTGVGWYSLFVAIMAIGYSLYNFVQVKDASFGVIWLYWSFLWFLFFLLLGLKQENITAFTGWITAIEGWVTAAIPAYLILVGKWNNDTAQAIALAVLAVVGIPIAYRLTMQRPPMIEAPGAPPGYVPQDTTRARPAV